MKHTTTYILVMKLIASGKTEGLADKVDLFFANNRLTDEEYEEIMSYLAPQTNEEPSEEPTENGEGE